MGNNNITLSVIIPTYNGSQHIRDTLESVFSQVVKRDDVEFIIRDNASTDNTGEIIKELNNRYGNVAIYDRRRENSIADMNYREAVDLAKGTYILLLGDDDLLFPNAINRIMQLIDKFPNAGLIYLNRISTTRNYEGANLKHQNPSHNFYREYTRVIDFIKDNPSGPDFMSVNVFHKDCWNKGLRFAKSVYYGVEWYSIILAGLKNSKIVTTFEPLILQRSPKKRVWSDRSLLYVVGGMSKMFYDLNEVYPGIYDIWEKYSQENIPRKYYIVSSVKLNRNLYKEKKNEIIPFLSRYERFIFKSMINFPFLEFPIRTVNYIVNRVRKFIR